MRRALAFVLTLAAAVAFAPGRHTAPVAAQAGEVHRAAVVVDLGNGEVRSACVRFRQESITGIDLLRAARMDPVVQTYAGQGGAVCKLCGVGCNAGGGCLTCQSPRYWQYWRSDGGTGTYTYSQAGAGNTAVTDGDVEGWSWSGGEDPPPFLTVAEACSGPNVYDYQPSSSSPTSLATTTAPPTTAATPVSPTTLAPPVDRSARTAPSQTTSPVLAAAGTATSTSAPVGEADERAQAPEPARDTAEGADASSQVTGLIAFALVLAAILAWTANMRKGRRAR